MRDLVVYVGGFGLPDRSASALRALGNASVLRASGYDVLIAGKFAEVPSAQNQPTPVQGFACHDIRRPLPGLPLVDYTVSPSNVRALLDHAGHGRIAAIMAYNYPGFGLHRLISLGKELGIPVINETTEWYGWEGIRPVTNVRRILESRWRNSALVERAGNLVCATRWTRDRHPGVNAMVLPFALDPDWEFWEGEADATWCRNVGDAPRFVYSGSPGLGMHKDRLPLIVEALDRADGKNQRFRFGVVGISESDYLAAKPAHADLLQRQAESIRFLGRMSHREAVSVLKSADMAVFVRARNRISEVGFPTKYAEATTCGIPVMTNRTSDIDRYLVDGRNGILLPGCDPASISAGFDRALGMSRRQLEEMKRRVAGHNPFAIQEWVPDMRAFMENLRLPQ